MQLSRGGAVASSRWIPCGDFLVLFFCCFDSMELELKQSPCSWSFFCLYKSPDWFYSCCKFSPSLLQNCPPHSLLYFKPLNLFLPWLFLRRIATSSLLRFRSTTAERPMAEAPEKISITICGDGGCGMPLIIIPGRVIQGSTANRGRIGKSSMTLRLVRSQWVHE